MIILITIKDDSDKIIDRYYIKNIIGIEEGIIQVIKYFNKKFNYDIKLKFNR